MSVCYYCGKVARWICDHFDECGHFCERAVCEEHSVPEFRSSTRDAWTLCKDHQQFQQD